CGPSQRGMRSPVGKSLRSAAALAIFALVSLTAGSKLTERGKAVDSGSFGIYVGGQRVGTEQFRVDQLQNGDSITSSEISVQEGELKATQSSELEISGKGELVRYAWHEQSPGKSEATVEPTDIYLTQHVILTPNGK